MTRWVLALAVVLGWACDARGQEYHGKATVTAYRAGGDTSLDANVRYSSGNVTGWVGYYGTPGRDQARAGVEYDLKRHDVYLVPSVQVASHGFYGASLYSEVGPAVYLIAGVSRTNLHPYANLTFDPNESWQLGAGWHLGQDSLAGFTIWDNRLHTGQQITHLVLKHYLPRKDRVTFDTSYKSGHGDGGVYVRGRRRADRVRLGTVVRQRRSGRPRELRARHDGARRRRGALLARLTRGACAPTGPRCRIRPCWPAARTGGCLSE